MAPFLRNAKKSSPGTSALGSSRSARLSAVADFPAPGGPVTTTRPMTYSGSAGPDPLRPDLLEADIEQPPQLLTAGVVGQRPIRVQCVCGGEQLLPVHGAPGKDPGVGQADAVGPVVQDRTADEVVAVEAPQHAEPGPVEHSG